LIFLLLNFILRRRKRTEWRTWYIKRSGRLLLVMVRSWPILFIMLWSRQLEKGGYKVTWDQPISRLVRWCSPLPHVLKNVIKLCLIGIKC